MHSANPKSYYLHVGRNTIMVLSLVSSTLYLRIYLEPWKAYTYNMELMYTWMMWQGLEWSRMDDMAWKIPVILGYVRYVSKITTFLHSSCPSPSLSGYITCMSWAATARQYWISQTFVPRYWRSWPRRRYTALVGVTCRTAPVPE